MDYSIIIPAKNEEYNIDRCLKSISQLDYPIDKYEVLLVDNGSTDQTVDIAKSYNASVFVKPDLTIVGLRNFGALSSKGRILVFLDADCTVFPDWLTTASIWMDNESVSCFGGPPEIPENSTWVQKSWYLVREKNMNVIDVDWLESMNMFVRKETFNEIHGFDESLTTCEDYDLSLRLKKYGRIVADKKIRAIHHGEAANIIHFYKKESWRGTSNLNGLLRHGFHWRELPSLLVPFVYLFCFLVSIALFITAFWQQELFFTLFLPWSILWQTVLMCLAFYKGRYRGELPEKAGLYILLNVYFFARSRAMLRFK